jgi:cell division protein FtsN
VKDFKPRPAPVRKTSIGNTLVGIFIGLVLGLLICAAIAVYMMKSPFPWSARPRPPEKTLNDSRSEPATSGGAVTQGRPAAGSDAPRFDFPSVLPSKEGVPLPSGEGSAAVARPARPVDSTGAVEHYILQAGAFQSPADADSLKARLALLGLEANIETVDLPDRGTWYRVRLGPYGSLGELNHVRSQLAQNGVDASLVKNASGR